MNTPIPNAARIFGQTGVLRADNGGRRRIGRCGHSLFGKAGMDGEQCHYQQHQSAAQQADIVKGSERVSSLGAHRFILFGVLHPPHQRFGVLFAFGVHFFKAGAVLGQGGHSLGAVRGDDADKALSLQLPRPLDSRVVPPCPSAAAG